MVYVVYDGWSTGGEPDSVWSNREDAEDHVRVLNEDYYSDDYDWKIAEMKVG
jgi:hypothetical protein